MSVQWPTNIHNIKKKKNSACGVTIIIYKLWFICTLLYMSDPIIIIRITYFCIYIRIYVYCMVERINTMNNILYLIGIIPFPPTKYYCVLLFFCCCCCCENSLEYYNGYVFFMRWIMLWKYFTVCFCFFFCCIVDKYFIILWCFYNMTCGTRKLMIFFLFCI